MTGHHRHPWLRQFVVLFVMTSLIGCGSTYLVYRQALNSSSRSAVEFMKSTAVEAAHSPAWREGASDLAKPLADRGVKKVTFVEQSLPDTSSSVQPSTVYTSVPLAFSAQEALRTQQPVLRDVSKTADGEVIRTIYVPLSAASLAVVEIDQFAFLRQITDIDLVFRAAFLMVCLISLVVSFALSGGTWISLSVRHFALSGLRSTRRWITIGLVVVSVALLLDATLGHLQIKRASENAKVAASALQLAAETASAIQQSGTSVDQFRLQECVNRLSASGEFGLADLARDVLASNGRNTESIELLRMRIDQYASESRETLDEAGKTASGENSTQAVRLVVTIAVGLSALLLMSAVSAKEHEIEAVRDETTLAKLEYQSMIGNMPIGLLAYANEQVLYTNGPWGDASTDKPERALDKLVEADRNQLLLAIHQSETEQSPFTLLLRVRGENGLKFFEVYGAPVIDEAGSVKRVHVFCIDITSTIRAQEEIQRKHTQLEDKNYQLRAAITQIESSLQNFVETIVRAVESRDPYTAGHSSRVGQYSLWIGLEMGLSDYDLRILSHGALVHDVGKIGIPDNILLKPDKLTREEFGVIQEHPDIGARILGDLGLFRDSLPIVKWHHERLDGTGYPDGLVGEDIPLVVRIVAVADVFDAMTSSRSYRKKISLEETFNTMAQDVAAGKLDAIAFKCLKTAVEKHGIISQPEAA